MDALFNILFYGAELKPTGIAVGLALVAGHLFALLKPDLTQDWLKQFPRNHKAGIGILFLALLWSFLVVTHMDLGEFHSLRTILVIGLPVGFVLTVLYVDEFLAVRALGALLLLFACPVLGAAFQQPPVSRLLLVVLAYAWVVAGMFWVGMPYLLRDEIRWVTAVPGRFRAACFGGIAYGILVLACALVFY